MSPILTTERLLLRPFTLTDAPFVIALLNSEAWLAYIGDRQVHTTEAAEKYLANGILKQYADCGYGLSVVALRESGEAIGMCGIVHRPTLPLPDIGFAFLPDFTGQGFAYEMAHATLLHAQTVWQLPTILAIVLPANVRSISLLEKLGFQFVEPIQMPNDPETLMLFRYPK
jgi:RimJ/RimL family protein N-acetyltransferase